MTITYSPYGYISGFSYNDINSAYRSGTGPIWTFDMQAFMNSSASSFVRPTSFGAFAEVSNYVKQTGQPITFQQYFTQLALQQPGAIGKTGAALQDFVDGYVRDHTSVNFQRYFDGDFSQEGLFNKYVWGSTSYKILGAIAPDGANGVVFNGEIRVFDEAFRFQEQNKTGLVALLPQSVRG